ncbi:MAG: helix-turn-helix transcriptional regulator [Shimia sp.]
MNLKDHLTAVTEAHSVEDLWETHLTAMAGFGFDRLMYGFTRYLTQSSIGDPQDTVLLTNHASAYVDGFVHNGLYFHAPMMKWARTHNGACSWSVMRDMVESGTLTESEKKVFAFNREHGVIAGYTISFAAVSQRSKGAIALTARNGLNQDAVDAIWAEHGTDIELMNTVAHLKIMSLPYTSARPLTKRQREVLEWVGDGKTTQDIAMLMGLTPATIEKHLRLAREALDVDTTAQAVLKAAFQNQMFILDA